MLLQTRVKPKVAANFQKVARRRGASPYAFSAGNRRRRRFAGGNWLVLRQPGVEPRGIDGAGIARRKRA